MEKQNGVNVEVGVIVLLLQEVKEITNGKTQERDHRACTCTRLLYALTVGNKFNHCDLTGRQRSSDILKCALLFSLPFSINLFLLSPSHLVPASAEVTLESHGGASPILFPPHFSLFVHICIPLASPSFNVFFCVSVAASL